MRSARVADETDEEERMMDGWNMTGWGWMGLAPVLAIVVISLVVWTMLRDSSSRSVRGTEEDQALAVLRRRFASGEIDEDEFNRRRAALDRPNS